MKKLMLLAATASVALVGCVNDEKMEMTSEAQKISFDNPVMNTQTRAEVNGEITVATYPESEKFVVYAMHSATELTLSTWANGTNFWGTDGTNGLTVQKEANGDWEHESKDYYWPKDGYLSFAAYSPAELSDGGTVTYGNNGWTVTDFTVNGTVGNQIDLMCATPVFNQQEPETETGVPTVFKHVLSSIVFTAVENDDAYTYKINSITVRGDIAMNGNMSSTITGELNNLSMSFAWGHNGQSATSLNKALSFDVPESSNEFFLSGTDALLLIPQDNIGNVEVTLNISRTAAATSATEPAYNKTVKLSDFKISASENTVTKWEAGKRYVYNFTIGGTKKIFFTPSVTEWEDVTLNVEI